MLAAACVGILIGTLAGCVRPEPTQDSVLDEGYLAYPNATKTHEEFHRGSRGGWNPEGQGESPDPSSLFIAYDLSQPTPPEDILSWYEEQLLAREGWAVQKPKWGPSSTTLRKQVGDTAHTITIRTLTPSTDKPRLPYEDVGEGEAATRYTVQYILHFR